MEVKDEPLGDGMDLLRYIGSSSTQIKRFAAMISGERPIARNTLIIAQAEGRNYLAELQRKHDDHVLLRLHLAEELAANGFKVHRLDEYRAAARALQASK